MVLIAKIYSIPPRLSSIVVLLIILQAPVKIIVMCIV